MHGQKRRKLNNGSNLRLILALLVVLVLASSVLVGNLFNRYAAGDRNVISVVVEGFAHQIQHNDPNFPIGGNPEMENFDQRWEASASVDLFKTTYTDAAGNVIVQSSNGDPIIAPGTQNEYPFSLKNTGNISLDFKLNLAGSFSVADHHLPIYVRLYSEGRWLLGGENEWVHIDLIGDILEERTLAVGESVTYRFDWQWPSDMDDESLNLIHDLNDAMLNADQNDTQLGNFSASDLGVDFKLDIKTTSVITEGAIATYKDGIEPITEFVLVVLMGGIALAVFLWLCAILFRRHVYLTGIVSYALENKARLGARRTHIINGRFAFSRVRLGRCKVKVGKASCKLKIQCVDSDSDLFLRIDKNTYVITVSRKIRAIELYFTPVGRHLKVSATEWAVIDKKHNVYTAYGMTPADRKTRSNTTPGGLSVDGKGRYTAE